MGKIRERQGYEAAMDLGLVCVRKNNKLCVDIRKRILCSEQMCFHGRNHNQEERTHRALSKSCGNTGKNSKEFSRPFFDLVDRNL